MHVFVERMRLSNSVHKNTFITHTQTQNVLSLNAFHFPGHVSLIFSNQHNKYQNVKNLYF